MKRLALLAIAATALVGCAEKPEPMADPPAGEQTQSKETAQSPGTGGNESVNVISPAAGGISPVTGSDSVAGGSSGGSGVGQAAKDQAKRAAAKASGSSLNQEGGY